MASTFPEIVPCCGLSVYTTIGFSPRVCTSSTVRRVVRVGGIRSENANLPSIGRVGLEDHAYIVGIAEATGFSVTPMPQNFVRVPSVSVLIGGDNVPLIC
jgi:hypothetical protein